VNGATGADSTSCTNPGAPCRTIHWAVSHAGTGDTIHVDPNGWGPCSGTSCLQAPYPEHIQLDAGKHLVASSGRPVIDVTTCGNPCDGYGAVDLDGSAS